jgi:DNA-binding NarL/FixJ family response regulator
LYFTIVRNVGTVRSGGMTDPKTSGPSAVPDLAEAGALAARPKVFILSNVRLYYEGLSWNLVREGSLDVVGAAEPSAAGIGRLRELDPDVIILDMATPRCLDLARELRSCLARIKLVAFAVNPVDCELVACAKAGISGYVPRDGAVGDLVGEVLNAVRGELHCSPRFAALLLQQVASLSAVHAGEVTAAETGRGGVGGVQVLTPRESEILGHIDRGLSNKEIARVLNISCATVKNHVHNSLDQLRVGRRTEALARLRDRSISALSTAATPALQDRRSLRRA